jgi:arylsulfatase/uncharacterized sulfatase
VISGEPLGDMVSQTSAFAWATDVAATILSMAGVAAAGERYAGKPVLPMTGKDLSPLFDGSQAQIHSEEDAIGYELTGHAALFQGDYKLVKNLAPLGDGQWRLYDIVRDPGETIDLKSEMPDRYQQMLSAFEQYTLENRVQPIPQGYSRQGQLMSNFLVEQLSSGVIVGLLTLLVLLPFVVYRRRNR